MGDAHSTSRLSTRRLVPYAGITQPLEKQQDNQGDGKSHHDRERQQKLREHAHWGSLQPPCKTRRAPPVRYLYGTPISRECTNICSYLICDELNCREHDHRNSSCTTLDFHQQPYEEPAGKDNAKDCRRGAGSPPSEEPPRFGPRPPEQSEPEVVDLNAWKSPRLRPFPGPPKPPPKPPPPNPLISRSLRTDYPISTGWQLAWTKERQRRRMRCLTARRD